MSDGAIGSTKFRYVEACAGAGGMGLGLHMAGWTGTGMELDPDAVATHNANVGACLAADITTASAPHGADLVAGGVPCQSFSMAGKGEGLDDPRGQLFASLLRLAVEAGARCVLMENVRGLKSRGALPTVLAAFRAHGFHAVHSLLSADDYGVPQTRVRLFIVGFRDVADLARFRWPEPSHGEPGNLLGLPRHRTIRDALALGDGVFEHGLLPHAKPESPQGMRILNVDRPAPTIGGKANADLLDRPAHTVSAGGTATGGGRTIRKRRLPAAALRGTRTRRADRQTRYDDHPLRRRRSGRAPRLQLDGGRSHGRRAARGVAELPGGFRVPRQRHVAASASGERRAVAARGSARPQHRDSALRGDSVTRTGAARARRGRRGAE